MSQTPAIKSPTLTFIDSHRPTLDTGDYSLEVSQTITGDHIPEKQTAKLSKKEFSVRGERFAFAPADFHGVFPPDRSEGEYLRVLPHAILNRSTLPWERAAEEKLPSKDHAPWLALLLFTEKELEHSQPHIVSVKDLKAKSETSGKPYWPGISVVEKDQKDGDKVTVIDVPVKLLKGISAKNEKPAVKGIMPSLAELKLLTHARIVSGEKETAENSERAVVVGSRLPYNDKGMVAHLVSVEGRYKNGQFDYQGADDTQTVRLVTLKNWSFTCKSPKKTFSGLVQNLNFKLLFSIADHDAAATAQTDLNKGNIPQTIKTSFAKKQIALDTNAAVTKTAPWLITNGDIRYRVTKSGSVQKGNLVLEVHQLDGVGNHTLRLPDSKIPQSSAAAKKYGHAGYIPLPHKMRNGDQSFSWYHGPLSPVNYAKTKIKFDQFPHRTADDLLRYDKKIGMYDVSYSSAWELGRLMALDSKAFSIELYKWKRTHAQALRQIEEQELNPHKPHKSHVGSALIMPTSIETWFNQLSLLHDVPYNYLVPDDSMLPAESIRFFTVDPEWVACLIDGAFSIGRVTEADHKHDANNNNHAVLLKKAEPICGVLLRSAVVPGWPTLQINAFKSGAALPLVRQERLSPSVLLCLFSGEADSYKIHEKPEAIHFGFNRQLESGVYEKYLRNSAGKEIKKKDRNPKYILKSGDDFEIDTTSHKVDIVKLSDKIKKTINTSALADFKKPDGYEYSPAYFALEMVAGVEEVEFKLAG